MYLRIENFINPLTRAGLERAHYLSAEGVTFYRWVQRE